MAEDPAITPAGREVPIATQEIPSDQLLHYQRASSDHGDQQLTPADAELASHILRISPNNGDALAAMDRLRSMVEQQPPHPSLAYQGQFITTVDDAEAIDATLASTSASSDNDDLLSDDNDRPNVIIKRAVFDLKLTCPPNNPRLWVMGRGMLTAGPESKPTYDADLYVPTTDRRVRPRHVVFEFGAQGDLYLHARHQVVLDGQTVAKATRRLLHKESHTLRISQLEFDLGRIRPAALNAEYQSALATYASENSIAIAVHPVLSIPPTPASYIIGNQWVVYNVVGSGGHDGEGGRTFIEAATNATGTEYVAIKTCKRFSSDSAKKVAAEVEMLKTIRDKWQISYHPEKQFVLRLKDAIYSKASEKWDGLPDKVHILYTPLATGDWHEVLIADVNARRYALEDRMQLCVEALMGLRWLHMQGFMHRDIKPHNLGVLQPSNKAVILDLGQSIQQKQDVSRPKHCGTIGYLAPELENEVFCHLADIYQGEKFAVYDEKVDIFSFGVVMLEVLRANVPTDAVRWSRSPNPFLRRECPDDLPSDYKRAMKALEAFAGDSKENLLWQMLQSKPADRVSVYSALQHPSMSNLHEAEVQRLREEDMKQQEIGEKRKKVNAADYRAGDEAEIGGPTSWKGRKRGA